MKNTGQKLVILPKRNGYDPARHIPKYGIGYDAQYFNLESLVRMYGEAEVKRYLQSYKR